MSNSNIDTQSNYFDRRMNNDVKPFNELAPEDQYISRARIKMDDTRVNYERKKREQLKAMGMKEDNEWEHKLYENIGNEFRKNEIDGAYPENNQTSRYETAYIMSRASKHSDSSRRDSQNNLIEPTNDPRGSNDNRELMSGKGECSWLNSDETFVFNQKSTTHMDKLEEIQERPRNIVYMKSEADNFQDSHNNGTNHLLRRPSRKLPDVDDTLKNINSKYPNIGKEMENVNGMLSHQSKTLLPKVYSDDTDLFNPKPMNGNQITFERNYDTFPVVTKRTTRPSLQDVEKSMVQGRLDYEDKILDESTELSMRGPFEDSDELYAHKSNRRRRVTRRNKTNIMEDENTDDTVRKVDEHQSHERPNQLSLLSSYQDLVKKFQQSPERTEQNGGPVKNRRWSTSSSDSYCSIESARDNIWPRSSTPDSTSSSPIIWNFSHFYFEKKV